MPLTLQLLLFVVLTVVGGAVGYSLGRSRVPQTIDDADVIADFRGNDTIVLDSEVYDLDLGQLAGGRFVTGSEARDANDRLIYDDRSGKLFFDADGSGNGDQVLIATLTPNDSPPLTAADIIVV